MRLLRPFVTILLLALWFGAREHCTLEAAGLIADHCAEDCGKATGAPDGCDAVENSYYKNAGSSVKVAAPQLLVCLILAVPPLEVASPSSSPVSPPRYVEQQTLHRTWQFVERAAPPCRAPSLLA